MMKFNFTKQIITAALVASVGFFGCQKNEMDEVDTLLMASNTQNLITDGLELKFGTPGAIDADFVDINPILAGNPISISARRLDGTGTGSGVLKISEYRVSDKPSDKANGGGDWFVVLTTDKGTDNLKHFTWTPSVENIGNISYKAEFSGTKSGKAYSHTIENTLQVVNPCTEGDVFFNGTSIFVSDDANGIRGLNVEYSLDFCLEDARRVEVRALLLQPEEVDLAADDDLGLVSNQGKNKVVTWTQDATSGSYNFGVSFSKKFKGNGPHKLTGVWNAKIYNEAGEVIAEINNPSHAQFE